MAITHAEAKARLLEGDPELAETYAAGEPAFLVARAVIEARAALSITQAELARRMGTSQSVVSRLENMEGSPNMRTVVAIAKALGMRVELRFVSEEPEYAEAVESTSELVAELVEQQRQVAETLAAVVRSSMASNAAANEAGQFVGA